MIGCREQNSLASVKCRFVCCSLIKGLYKNLKVEFQHLGHQVHLGMSGGYWHSRTAGVLDSSVMSES